ncbi:hypothetical protein [Labrenzia sp. DG1229]|uniref:hypothetical protein n=1 Tax=Labrenzia sp. DG1229 TaxID=681847 RepID=UPI000490DEC8|nr:hypothetical protein [Labrenzia sp. DG1229]
MSEDPIFNVPLSEEDFIQLGKLTSAWSQIDHLLLMSISKMLNISLRDCELLFDTAAAGVRINAFKKLAKNLGNPEVKALADEFVSKSAPVLGKRNHIAHGVWGLFAAEGGQPRVAACYHPPNKKGLVYADELGAIVETAVSVANILAKFVSFEEKQEIKDMSCREIYFGYGSPEGKYDGDMGSVYLDLESLGHSFG